MSGKGPELARLWLRKADTSQRYGRNVVVSPNEFRATTNMKNKTIRPIKTMKTIKTAETV